MTDDPREQALVQESWTLVEPIADTAAGLFYGRLFEMDRRSGPCSAAT